MTPQLRQFIERRVRSVFGRFWDREGRVDVSLVDENGHKGGADTTCLILANIDGQAVVVTERRTSAFSAASRAFARAGQTLTRRLERRRLRRA
ncbi:MAG: hypothetical protein CMJ47_02065 [Planctomyces sp.]|nr:hypothetical protein [Planctomyces sp.]